MEGSTRGVLFLFIDWRTAVLDPKTITRKVDHDSLLQLLAFYSYQNISGFETKRNQWNSLILRVNMAQM
jgi:hypothetical protein